MVGSPSGRSRPVLLCEDLGQELERPPLAAVRLLRAVGVKIPLRAWLELPVDLRWSIATEGARDTVEISAARALIRHVPMRYIELIGDHATPEDQPLPGVLDGLGLPESWARGHWHQLSPFARYVLNVLRNNRRLLWRAFAEMNGVPTRRYDGWRGPVARAVVALGVGEPLQSELMSLLNGERLLGGRGLLLARTSGVRAARAAATTFDLHAEVVTGSVELDWATDTKTATVLWQAHVSTAASEFFPAAALVGATTAATCLVDLLRELDPLARLRSAELTEEEWQVGKMEPEAGTISRESTLVIKP